MSETKENIGFALRDISIEQFAIVEASFNKGEKVGLKADVKFGLDEEHKIVSTLFKVNFLQNDAPFLILAVECFFGINESAWETFLKDKTLTIPQGFAAHLAMLTVGTARGVLYTKTEKTEFRKFLLPTINVNELIRQDIVFEL